MWVTYEYEEGERPLLLHQYHPTRSADVPKKLLKNYSGFVQTDGYKSFQFSDKEYTGTITHVSCLAHVRRYFEKAYKANKKSECAHTALKYIRNMYSIENNLRERKLTYDEFVEKRKRQMTPVFEKFHNWLVEQQKNVLPGSLSGEAVSYTLGQWDKIPNFLDHHLLTPDNNKTENAIRPFVIGRKTGYSQTLLVVLTAVPVFIHSLKVPTLVETKGCCSGKRPGQINWNRIIIYVMFLKNCRPVRVKKNYESCCRM
jgi:transposase